MKTRIIAAVGQTHFINKLTQFLRARVELLCYLFFSDSCIDPVCNMNIDSVTQELQVATDRIKKLQMQLAQINQTNGNGNGGIRQRILPDKQHLHQNFAEIETVL